MIKQRNLVVAVCGGAMLALPALAFNPSGYGGGVGATQSPSAFSSGSYGQYYSPSGGYISIPTNGGISTPHRAAWQSYQAAVARRPQPAAPCGGYLRKPLACKQHTLAYRDYVAMNR